MSGEDSGIEAVWEMVECEFQMERKSRRWKVKGGKCEEWENRGNTTIKV